MGIGGKCNSIVQEVCHLLIVRKVLDKKDLGAAESRLLQCGGVGLLFSRKAGQDTAREVGNYLKLLRAFFQREEEVVYYLWEKKIFNLSSSGEVQLESPDTLL